MQPARRLDDAGTRCVRLDAFDLARAEPQGRRDRVERRALGQVDVDPRQLVLADRTEVDRVRVDGAIVAVRVEQPRANPAVQRRTARRAAAMAATIATPYWIACMDRSAGRRRSSCGSLAGWSASIDEDSSQ
jgi:hypothetical protein